jgi:hypothetical protein
MGFLVWAGRWVDREEKRGDTVEGTERSKRTQGLKNSFLLVASDAYLTTPGSGSLGMAPVHQQGRSQIYSDTVAEYIMLFIR